MADCPEPEKCYNCRKEGHSTADCPDPEVCRRCRKEEHKVAECPDPQICNRCLTVFFTLIFASLSFVLRCGAEGHMVRDCTEEEKTRAWTDEEGKVKEIYVPKEEGSVSDLARASPRESISPSTRTSLCR